MSDMQNNISFQTQLEKIVGEHQRQGRIPSLLLHSCCGPCSSYVVTFLKTYFRITVLFYNPNIYPEEEYRLRLLNQERLLKELGIELLEVPYSHQEFLDAVRGLEAEPEGGARCSRCFSLRLEKTFAMAKEHHFDYCCTTLTVSPHKNAAVINSIGRRIEQQQSKVLWLPSDFKKRDGYKQSIELSKKYGLYRQNYCGCEFSLQAGTREHRVVDEHEIISDSQHAAAGYAITQE